MNKITDDDINLRNIIIMLVAYYKEFKQPGIDSWLKPFIPDGEIFVDMI